MDWNKGLRMETQPGYLKETDEDRREAFRIDDSLPVIIRKIEDSESSQILESDQEDLKELSQLALQDGGINPTLWKMLVTLHKKMDRILERLPVDLLKVKTQPINLSATGMKIQVNKKFNLDEEVRIKILLPTLPISEIIIVGRVIRIKALEDGHYELGLEFQELDEEVREELIQYSLKQQRKALLAQRQKRGNNESPPEKGR
jgi:hypothetical protein